jgi:hypothetical protein
MTACTQCDPHTRYQRLAARKDATICCFIHIAIPIIIEGQFQVFQRFSSSKLVLRTVESRFTALNYYENGSTLSIQREDNL